MVNVKKFKDMTEDEKQAYLEERKQISKEKYEEICSKNKEAKEKRKAFKAEVHKGNQLLKEYEDEVEDGKKLEALMWTFFPSEDRRFEGTILVLPQKWDDDDVVCRYSYAIKAPSDVSKVHVAKGLCSARAHDPVSPWSGNVIVPRFVFDKNKQRLQQVITSTVMSEILLCEDHIPMRLVRSIYKGI